MCSLTGFFMQNAQGDWTKVGEFEYEMFVYLLKKFPSGILSLVMDTFDLWRAITEYCVKAKDLIMSRDGKLVIRPDSGDPVDILCGKYPTFGDGFTCEDKGVIELLWDIFGGTVSSTGYKVLDSHIGAIYGDSINYDRAQRIFERLANKGFASTNVVLGIGSYSLQHVTRDTHGSAQKATYIEILQGDKPVGIEIFKDPITDGGTKKSAKGLLQVYEEDGVIKLKDQCSWEEEGQGLLQVIFEDGKFYNLTTLTRIREKLNN
jgi:nicotinamide phosphoribosyltransferase